MAVGDFGLSFINSGFSRRRQEQQSFASEMENFNSFVNMRRNEMGLQNEFQDAGRQNLLENMFAIGRQADPNANQSALYQDISQGSADPRMAAQALNLGQSAMAAQMPLALTLAQQGDMSMLQGMGLGNFNNFDANAARSFVGNGGANVYNAISGNEQYNSFLNQISRQPDATQSFQDQEFNNRLVNLGSQQINRGMNLFRNNPLINTQAAPQVAATTPTPAPSVNTPSFNSFKSSLLGGAAPNLNKSLDMGGFMNSNSSGKSFFGGI